MEYETSNQGPWVTIWNGGVGVWAFMSNNTNGQREIPGVAQLPRLWGSVVVVVAAGDPKKIV